MTDGELEVDKQIGDEGRGSVSIASWNASLMLPEDLLDTCMVRAFAEEARFTLGPDVGWLLVVED